MSESPNESEQKDPAVARRGNRWDVSAIIAASIGFLALLVGGYTAYIQRQQVRAQVWPYLSMGESDYLPGDDATAGQGFIVSHGGVIQASNSGVGPALVRSIEVDVNGNPQPDWPHVFRALDVSIPGTGYTASSLNGKVMPADARVNMLVVYGQKAWVDFRHKFFTEVTVHYCYCSTLHDCWTGKFGKANQIPQKPRASCPKVAVMGEFRGSGA